MTDDEPAPHESAARDPRQAGIEQLQRAALDAIGAARTMLEVAESLVRDPAAVDALVHTVAAFGKMASDAVSQAVSGVRSEGDPPQPGPRDDGDGDGVERISVS